MVCGRGQHCLAPYVAGITRRGVLLTIVAVSIAIAGFMCTVGIAKTVHPSADIARTTKSLRRLSSPSLSGAHSSPEGNSSSSSLFSSLVMTSTAPSVSSAHDSPPNSSTLFNPDPSLLAWDFEAEFLGVTLKVGWLNVPLYHEKNLESYENAPRFCLRVLAIPAAEQPATNGPLMMHCGGPGSSKDCAFQLPARLARGNESSIRHILRHFDVWGIDQRGIGDQLGRLRLPGYTTPPCPFQQAGQSVGEFPEIYCNELQGMSKTRILELLGENVGDSVWTNTIVPIIMSGGLDGLKYTDEAAVRWYYRLVRLSHNLCYSARRYTKQSPLNGRTFNVLDFSGTSDLAYDIDLFRQAIGAKHMSVWGFSYGTYVGGVYASIFPSKVFRMILDGAVSPLPDVAEMSTQFAKGRGAVLDGVASACDNSRMQRLPTSRICSAAPRPMSKVLEMMSMQDDRALAISLLIRIILFGEEFKEDVPAAPILLECIEAFYTGKELIGCPFAIDIDASSGNSSARSNIRSKTVQIPRQCLDRPETCLANTSSFSGRGVDARGLHTGSRSDWATMKDGFGVHDATAALFGSDFGFGFQASVLGLDVAGRLDEDSLIHWWRQSLFTYPIATNWALVWAVGLSTWPALPTPVPPLGGSQVTPVIVGNLHDPQTAYNNAQQMKDAFPGGSLVTWQGYGHCTSTPRDSAATAEAYWDAVAHGKTPEYTLDTAKLLCAELLYNYMGNGKIIQDGHTCRVPGPVEVGQDAALAYLPEFTRFWEELFR